MQQLPVSFQTACSAFSLGSTCAAVSELCGSELAGVGRRRCGRTGQKSLHGALGDPRRAAQHLVAQQLCRSWGQEQARALVPCRHPEPRETGHGAYMRHTTLRGWQRSALSLEGKHRQPRKHGLGPGSLMLWGSCSLWTNLIATRSEPVTDPMNTPSAQTPPPPCTRGGGRR